jgi:uncharacterized protein (DUF2147 family)
MKCVWVILILLPLFTLGQNITGKWKTIDESTGEEKSIVEIFEKDGEIHGKVIKILVKQEQEPDPVCDACPAEDPRYNKKIIGMEIIQGMKKSGDHYDDGTILDPEVGKIYRCRLWVEGNDLKVRGFWGPFYRTQTWKRSL